MTVSFATFTPADKIVMDGFKRPSELNMGLFSNFANAIFGFGAIGEPSTRDQAPEEIME